MIDIEQNTGEAQLDISVFIQCIEGSASRFSSGKRTTNRQYEREETRHETQDDDVLGIVTPLPLPPSFRPPWKHDNAAVAATPSFDVGPPQIHVHLQTVFKL